jgi:Tfp pilus assembly protein PilV
MRPERGRHPIRGQTLVSCLLALLILGSGTTGLTRWSAELLRTERDHALRQRALALLQDLAEDPATALRANPGASVAGFELHHRDQHDSPQGDAPCTVHRDLEVRWIDSSGTRQSLALRTQECARARAY